MKYVIAVALVLALAAYAYDWQAYVNYATDPSSRPLEYWQSQE